MKDEEKEAYFCHTHPNLFSQKKCKECYRGMCYTCLSMDEDHCSDCRRSSYLSGDTHKNIKAIRGMLIVAVIVLILTHVYQYKNDVQVYENLDFIKNLGITLFYTISIGFAFFLYEDTDILDEIRKVPFIGFKLMLATLIITVVLGLPVFYFLYKIYLLLKAKSIRSSVK
ncbi:hypothetical protein [Dokdonia sp.]|uniref:hypothetical protein n=1 Tax=Dokdonia sp. TaxID=2024995 RepID=UPI003263DCB6